MSKHLEEKFELKSKPKYLNKRERTRMEACLEI